MGGGSSIQLIRLFGIRIGASYSWFFVLFLLIWLLSGYFADVAGDTTQGFLLAVSAALLFFGSLTLHELGHALVARREGIAVVGIDLWFFGGVAKMSRDTNSPGEEFRVAAAGPAVTLVIVVACSLLLARARLSRRRGRRRCSFSTDADTPASWRSSVTSRRSTRSCSSSTSFPRSRSTAGGSRARWCGASPATGTRPRARPAYAGQGLAYLMIGLGIAMTVVWNDAFGGIWLAVLGWFLATAARSAVVEHGLHGAHRRASPSPTSWITSP